MLLIPHVLVRILEMVQVKHLLVDDGMNVIGLHGAVHLLVLQPRTHKHTPDSADVIQALEERGLVLGEASNKADDGDDAVDLDGLEGLRHGGRAADFDNVGDAQAARGELLRCLAPVGVLLVVDDVVGAVFLQEFGLLGGGGGGDDGCAGGFGELQMIVRIHSFCPSGVVGKCRAYLERENTNTAGPLRQHRVSGLQRPALQPIERIPRRQPRAAQRRRLAKVQILRLMHKSLFVERAVLPQRAVQGSAEARGQRIRSQRTGEMRLVEESDDLVAGLEAGDALADGLDDAGAVGAGDYTVLDGEGIFAFRDDEVAVVEGGGVDCGEAMLAYAYVCRLV